MFKLILASKSKVRKEILSKNNLLCVVKPSNVDEDTIKKSLLKNNATPEIISGDFFSFNKLSLNTSSSTLDGFTSLRILFLSSISFLTLLFEAKIILGIFFVFYLKNFYY